MIIEHFGMCDASAGVALSSTEFVMANDEDNFLRIYHTYQSGTFTQKLDVSDQIKNNPEHKEADIEGVALLQGTIYWITSHGRNKEGKFKPERYNFFANEITRAGDAIVYTPIGQSYTGLLKDLVQDACLKKYDLEEAATLAPKSQGGLNIEGLTASPNNELLIGFRNPIPGGQALLVPLKNPTEVIKGNLAEFGRPIELDLGGLGVRSIEYWANRGIYLIIAGSYNQDNEFRLYQWSGQPEISPTPLANVEHLSELRPEAIIIYPGIDDKFQILSDDGAVEHDGVECKDLANEAAKYFRSVWVSL
jgi:hypothetical protein